MSSGARSRSRSAASRAGRALLVLAVLAGVLAMHALPPAGMPASGEHGAMTALTVPGRDTAPARHPTGSRGALPHRMLPNRAMEHRALSQRDEFCRQPAGASDTGGTAMAHTGGTCAAAGISTPYAPPAPGRTVQAPAAARTGQAAQPAGGRAPPDLAELRLLRI